MSNSMKFSFVKESFIKVKKCSYFILYSKKLSFVKKMKKTQLYTGVITDNEGVIYSIFIWKLPRLSELTPIQSNTKLTHLGSNSSILYT